MTTPLAAIRRDLLLLGSLLSMLAGCGGGGGGGGGHSNPAPPDSPPAPTFSISASIAGLTGSGLVLQNGTSTASIATTGTTTLVASAANGTAYAISVLTQPSNPSQTCTVGGGTGAINGANVIATVTCVTNAFNVRAAVSGLAGSGLVLRNNGGDDLSIASNGLQSFARSVVSAESYDVAVIAQPSNPTQTCVVASGSGVIADSHVTVPVSCVTGQFRIRATVTGLADGAQLHLASNSTADLIVASNSTVTFSGTFASGTAYSINVTAQPAIPAQTCIVTPNAGSIADRDVDIAVACTTNSYFVGGAVSGLSSSGLALRNSNGETLPIDADGAFSFATPVISTGTFDVSIAQLPTNPAQACRVDHGSGTVTNANINSISVICSSSIGRFAYAVSSLDDTVSAYSIEANGARLRHFMYALTGTTPVSVSVEPRGRFVFVANRASNDVSAFAVDPSNGVLSAIPGSPFNVGAAPEHVAVDPTGRFAHVVNRAANTVSAFAIEPSTGALSTVAGSPFAVGADPSSITFDSMGQYAYVVNTGAGTVSAFAIHPVSGALTPIAGSPIAVGSSPVALRLEPKGRYAYVLNDVADTVAVFSVNASTGVLTSIVGSTVSVGADPTSIDIDPSGRVALVINGGAQTISAFAISQSTGLLTPAPGSPLSASSDPSAVAFDSSGQFAYVANYADNQIDIYAVNSTNGALTVHGRGISTRDGPSALALGVGTTRVAHISKSAYVSTQQGETLDPFFADSTGALGRVPFSGYYVAGVPVYTTSDPLGRYVYLVNQKHTDNIYVFNPDGMTGLVTLAPGSPVTAGMNPQKLAAEPSGRFAYVSNYTTNNISAFSVHATSGALSPLPSSPIASQLSPVGIAVDPSGRFLFVANVDSSNITAYAIDPATGALTQVVGSPFAVGAYPASLAADSLGKFLYAANANGASISAYSIDAHTGALTQVSGSPFAAGTRPISIAADPTGRFVYVSNNDASRTISGFAIDPSTGALSALPTSPYSLSNTPYGLTISPNGNFVYVARGNSVGGYAIDSTTGALSELSGSPFIGTAPMPTSITILGTLQ